VKWPTLKRAINVTFIETFVTNSVMLKLQLLSFYKPLPSDIAVVTQMAIKWNGSKK
jgi:hypothetical protein